jgi:hypothetical protein
MQTNQVRESENMAYDTTAQFEGATRKLKGPFVGATISPMYSIMIMILWPIVPIPAKRNAEPEQDPELRAAEAYAVSSQ